VSVLKKNSKTSPNLIEVIGKTPDGLRSVKVELDPEDYQVAFEAQKTGYIISISGKLRKEKNTYYLDNPQDIHPVADDYYKIDY